MVHSFLPISASTVPVGRDGAQGQPEQFCGRLVSREVDLRLIDLAQSGVDALDGIGGVDHSPDVRRECEPRNHLVPGSPACSYHGQKLLAPRALLKRS